MALDLSETERGKGCLVTYEPWRSGNVTPVSELRFFLVRNKVTVTFPTGGVISVKELERFISFYDPDSEGENDLS